MRKPRELFQPPHGPVIVLVVEVFLRERPRVGEAQHEFGELKVLGPFRHRHRPVAHPAGDERVILAFTVRGDEMDVDVHEVGNDLVKHRLDRPDVPSDVLADPLDVLPVPNRDLKLLLPRRVPQNDATLRHDHRLPAHLTLQRLPRRLVAQVVHFFALATLEFDGHSASSRFRRLLRTEHQVLSTELTIAMRGSQSNHTPSSACFKSSMRSWASSVPMLRRTKSGVTPVAACSSSVSCWCVVVLGWMMRLLLSPTLARWLKSFTRLISVRPASRCCVAVAP